MDSSDRDELWQQIEELEIENKQLQTNLTKYGMHLDDCPCFVPQGKWADNDHHTRTDEELIFKEVNGLVTITVKCTCGFDQALKG